MAKGTSTPTRVTNDVATTAALVAPTENRTVTEQINYWLRIGMHIERSTSAAGRRVVAVAAGEEQFSALSPLDQTVAHAMIDAQMADRVASQRFGPAARKAGHLTVSIDDDGTLIEIAPDGSRRPL